MAGELSFGRWLRQQRRQLDLTQAELAQQVGCAAVTIRKLEADELHPSKQMAERLALALQVPAAQSADFMAFARATPEDDPLPPPAPPRRHNLPLQLAPLIGRTTVVNEVAALLADPTVRLLTLIGPGGIGKTRLALAAAAMQLAHFSHGVYFVALAAVESSRAIVPLIAEALNFTFYAEGPPRQQLANYLGHKQMLLILDNFEQLLTPPPQSGSQAPDETSGVALLHDLLQVAPQLKLLVTSRVRLNIQGEQLYPVTGVDFPASDTTTAAIGQSSAVELFLQSARRLQPDFALTQENSAPIAAICRLVQGLPLAILLAAAWVELFTPTEILVELTTGTDTLPTFDFLTAAQQDLPARHRSLRALFDHSWRLLSPEEQRLWAQLSLFRGGFTREAARFVTEASPQLLLTLMNKSLLQRQQGLSGLDGDGQSRYVLHELVRHYAADQLAQMPAVHAVARERHSHFYCALLGAQDIRLQGAEQQAAIGQIELELENMQQAWQWAAQHQHHELLAQAMPSLGLFYQWRSRYQEGEAAYQLVVRHLETLSSLSPVARPVLAQALAWQSVFLRVRKRLPEADLLLQQSLLLLGDITPPVREVQQAKAFTLLQLGRLGEARADFAVCRKWYQQALALYATLQDDWGKSHALAGLGEIGYRSGDLTPGRRFYEESLALYRLAGDARNCAHVLQHLGYILRDQGYLAEAERVNTESLALYTGIGDRTKLAEGHYALAWTLIFAGHYDEAYAQVEKFNAIRTDLGLPTSLTLPGLINLELGNYVAARTQLETQLRHSRAAQDKDELALGLDVLSCLAIVESRYMDAQALVTEAIALHQGIGEQARLAHAQAFAGYTARALGQHSTAQHYFFQALQSTARRWLFDGALCLARHCFAAG
ncbi:MAG: helix-turn-helix domain-containing protein [Caldilineaceae bacterium]